MFEKKIVMLLTNAFEPDVRVLKEARSLTNNGFSVTILAWDRENRYPKFESIDNIRIERYHLKNGYGQGLKSSIGFLRFYLYIFLRLFNDRINIIHCHDLDTLLVGFLLAKIRGCKIIYDAHELEYFINFPNFLKEASRKIEKFISKRVNLILVVNQIQKRKFLNWNLTENRIIELRNCPTQKFFTTPNIEKKNGKKVIGWIGYIQRGIAVDKMIGIFDVLCEHYENLELLLVGKIHPNFQKDFENLIERIKNRLFIRVIGHVPYGEINQYYQQIDISFMFYENRPEFIYSSPTKLYESMAYGIPVIATPIGDVKEIIETCQCGFIVDVNNQEEILEKIIKLIENPRLRQEMGQRGYRYAKQNFSWEIMEHRLLKGYKTLIFVN